MDFVDASVYKRLDSGPTVTIPPGSTFYRGDGALGVATPPRTDMPAFFGDKGVATLYSKGNPETISSYRTKEPLTLFVVTIDSILEIVDEYAEDHRIHALIENGWLDEDENGTLRIRPAVPMGRRKDDPTQFTPGNRAFAELLCEKKYDGWIILPETLDESRASFIKKASDKHDPEIMLCNWTSKMELVEKSVSGGRRKLMVTRRRRGSRRKLHRLRSRRRR